MTWTRSHTTITTATASSVWTRWTTPEHWSTDDPGTEFATFDTPPTVGGKGRVKDTGSAAQNFTFTTLETNQTMTFEISLPGATMTFPHRMEDTPHGLKVTHTIAFRGLLARLYGFLVGRKLARALPEVVSLVVDHALSMDAPSRRG